MHRVKILRINSTKLLVAKNLLVFDVSANERYYHIMSSEILRGWPFLIAESAMAEYGETPYDSAHCYTLEAWDAASSALTADPKRRHGAFEAAELLLSEPTVKVSFVDANDQGKRARNGDERHVKAAACLLGFNDFRGTTDSDYKIMLNRFDGEDPGQYVLFSPPGAQDVPAGKTFFRGDFTFPAWDPFEKRSLYATDVPESLKLHKDVTALDEPNGNYFLVGAANARTLLAQVFIAAGFSFCEWPMTDDEHNSIFDAINIYQLGNTLPRVQRQLLSPNANTHNNPLAAQFSEQIAKLRLAEADFVGLL